ncbi:replication initiation negative regulator SeqA [Agarivorans sp.]|uniref:replication initiation negative regulator SeqA n=1 Tax=Agarivorans sp. TaxID=1872412 RepID=UPI003D050192
MKTIEIEEDLYLYIAGQTKHIGESASDILRRLLQVNSGGELANKALAADDVSIQQPTTESGLQEAAQTQQDTSIKTVTNKELAAHFELSDVAQAGSSTKRFLFLLSKLYSIDSALFSQACVIKGSKREYFSQDKQQLLASGKTTKPQAIPDTPYWVITNTNTARKRYILQHVASEMGLVDSLIERLLEAI